MEPVLLYSGNQTAFLEMILSARKKKDAVFIFDGNKFKAENSLFREAESVFGHANGSVTSWDIFDECLFDATLPYEKLSERIQTNRLLIIRNANGLLKTSERIQSSILSLLNDLDDSWNLRFHDDFDNNYKGVSIENHVEDYEEFRPVCYRYFYKSILFCPVSQISPLEDLLRKNKVRYSILE